MKTVIITSCKGRFHHFQKVIPSWLAYTDFQILVVDYGCPNSTTHHVRMLDRGLGLDRGRVLAMDLPAKPREFNKPIALNTGAYFAKTALGAERFLFLDTDTEITAALPVFDEHPGSMWIVMPTPGKRDLTGVIAVETNAFMSTGFDELMSDYGAEDIDLRVRLHLRAAQQTRFFPDCFSSIPHSDEERVLFHAEKDIAASGKKNVARMFGKLSHIELATLGRDPELSDVLLGAACYEPKASP